MHWKNQSSQNHKKKASEEIKIQGDVFFPSKCGIVYVHKVSEGQTVNQYYYNKVLIVLRERLRRRRPDLSKKNSWILHQDSVPAHSPLYVKLLFFKYGIAVLNYPPYWPLWLLYFLRSNRRLREQDLMVWKQSKGKRLRFSTSWQQQTSSTALNSGKFVWSFVDISMESTKRINCVI